MPEGQGYGKNYDNKKKVKAHMPEGDMKMGYSKKPMMSKEKPAMKFADDMRGGDLLKKGKA